MSLSVRIRSEIITTCMDKSHLQQLVIFRFSPRPLDYDLFSGTDSIVVPKW